MRVDRAVQDHGGPAGEKGRGLLDGEEGTLEVRRHRLVEQLFGHFLEGDESSDAGVDEERVDPPVPRLDLVHCLCDLRHSGHVRLDHQRVRTQLLLRGLEGGIAPPGDRHLGPFAEERLRRRESDAAVAARYHRHLVGESSAHRNLPRVAVEMLPAAKGVQPALAMNR